MTLLIGSLSALVVLLFAWGYHLRFAAQPVPDDIVTAVKGNEAKGFGPLGGLLDALGRPFEQMVLRALSPATRSKVRGRIERAGRPNGLTLEGYARNKAGNVVLYGSAGALGVLNDQALIGVALLAVGLVQTELVLWNLARERQQEIQKTLPDFLDVLTVTVSAGLGFRHALRRVAESMPGPLSEEMMTSLRQMELGTPMREAFHELRQRNDSEALSSFVTAILQAEELGSPLARALTEISADMRREAFQGARRRAQRADPQITLVVTFCMVPGMMVLVGAALYYGSGAELSRVFGG
jgi:pilus assembly protein TadC